MSKQDQLEWEARFGRPAALAAFAAGLLLLAATIVLQSMLSDRPGVEPLPDFLLSVADSPGTLTLQSVIQAVAVLSLIPVFYYLFRATVHRVPQMPRWFVYLIVLGPAMYAISQVLGAIDRVDVAEMFADRDYSFDTDDERLQRCPAIRGELGDDCASELLSENTNGLAIGLNLAGSVGVAFMYVMLPLRARRAGLLSPFMAILGVIAGVLLVLQLVPLVPIVIQAFWLGAVGALYLGNWPGGRGPAWESGEPDPWPTAAERRGLGGPPGEDGGAAGEAEPAEPEPELAEAEAQAELGGRLSPRQGAERRHSTGAPPAERPRRSSRLLAQPGQARAACASRALRASMRSQVVPCECLADTGHLPTRHGTPSDRLACPIPWRVLRARGWSLSWCSSPWRRRS